MSRNVDRVIGVVATISAGIAVFMIRQWLVKVVQRLRKQKRLENPQDGDEIFRERFLHSETRWHDASCHCGRIRFRLKASEKLKAVDVPSKLRFPRLTVKASDIDFLSEQHLLSTYKIRQGIEISIHTFCSYCGMHVFLAPCIESVYIIVNADCLDRTGVSDLKVTFFPAFESVPCLDAVDPRTLFSQELMAVSSPVPEPFFTRGKTSDSSETAPTTPTTSGDLAPMLSIWAQLPRQHDDMQMYNTSNVAAASSSSSSSSSAAMIPPIIINKATSVPTHATDEVKRRSGVDTPTLTQFKQRLQHYLPQDGEAST